ncbi:MAG: hypothetical protein E7458_09315 [Ruminococcaceae bacterium]|nr:hypothetical protein [Oscillospiraceae bacterium]
MRKRALCFLIIALLLMQTAFASGIGAFDRVGSYETADGLYYAAYDRTYNIDAHGSEPPLFTEELAPVSLSGLWGYVNTSGVVVIDLVYTSATQFSEGRAFVGTAAGIVCIDPENQTLFALDCTRAFPYVNGLAKFEKDGKYGFVDLDGTVVVPAMWDDAGYAAEGYIVVRKDGRYGYVDYSGNIFITPQYDSAAAFSGGAAYVQADGIGMLLNPEGDVICENVYSGIIEGLALTEGEDGWGFVDASGAVVIDCVWEDADLPSEGCIAVRKDGKWGYINLEGDTVIDFLWDYAWPYSDGIAMVALSQNGYDIDGFGYINSLGEEIVPCSYEDAKSFSDGRAAVCQDGKWGYIDVLGTQVVPCEYEYAADFHENFAVVGQNGVFSVIGSLGNAFTFYRQEEIPAEPVPEETPEDEPAESLPEILPGPEPQEPEKPKTSPGSIIAIIIAVLGISALAAVVLIREINIRRRRRRHLATRGGKRAK